MTLRIPSSRRFKYPPLKQDGPKGERGFYIPDVVALEAFKIFRIAGVGPLPCKFGHGPLSLDAEALGHIPQRLGVGIVALDQVRVRILNKEWPCSRF
jgi:hypothetical protein